MADLNPFGEMLVRLSVNSEDPSDLARQYREIHERTARSKRWSEGYFDMGFLCARAIAQAEYQEDHS